MVRVVWQNVKDVARVVAVLILGFLMYLYYVIVEEWKKQFWPSLDKKSQTQCPEGDR